MNTVAMKAKDGAEWMIVAVAAQAAIAIDNAPLHAGSITAEQQRGALAESSPQLVWTTTPQGAVEYCTSQLGRSRGPWRRYSGS